LKEEKKKPKKPVLKESKYIKVRIPKVITDESLSDH
jgi:hypothetical protein